MNDKKVESLSGYLAGTDIHTLAKRDEARYLRAVAEKEELHRRKEDEEKRKELQTKNFNKQSLNH
eukprot:CAMPEP_0202967572 /NCGR_PEP_ID=MMETSP1396-20130829/12479_1 /ASSEMBLY_ACC=CAM_ASM_000872 /TAXON_ID= /ORGANISM="Pseudokeronopsis sp., Strain Brazil" /LENGTH=64 /DNA_ID=CAMNT_0049692757 /DNA_START=667 /DNA_END=861 /DNA_ORIENTATION=+